MRELRTVVEGGTFFEGLRWHEGRWYASDFYANRVIAFDEHGKVEDHFEVEVPSGLGWLPDGSLLVVSMSQHKLFRRAPDGEAEVHADLSAYTRGSANDMVVDSQGRAWIGHYGYELGTEPPRDSSILRVDPDGTVTEVAGGVRFPNGPMLTEDERTLIVAETIANRFSLFTIEDDGSLTFREHLQTEPPPALEDIDERYSQVAFAPDGSSLDAEGCIWAADALHERCARISPSGEVLEEIPAPDDRHYYGAMLGGPDGRTLMLAAAPDWREERPEGELASEILMTRVEVPHAGRP